MADSNCSKCGKMKLVNSVTNTSNNPAISTTSTTTMKSGSSIVTTPIPSVSIVTSKPTSYADIKESTKQGVATVGW